MAFAGPSSQQQYGSAGVSSPSRQMGQPNYDNKTQWSPPAGAIKQGEVLATVGDMPGYSVDEVTAKPHRRMTAEECQRYNLPEGTLIMCTEEEMKKGVQPAPIGAPPQIADEEAQIKAFLAQSGARLWTGESKPTFASTGQPVPDTIPIEIPHVPGGGRYARGGGPADQNQWQGSQPPLSAYQSQQPYASYQQPRF